MLRIHSVQIVLLPPGPLCAPCMFSLFADSMCLFMLRVYVQLRYIGLWSHRFAVALNLQLLICWIHNRHNQCLAGVPARLPRTLVLLLFPSLFVSGSGQLGWRKAVRLCLVGRLRPFAMRRIHLLAVPRLELLTACASSFFWLLDVMGWWHTCV